MSNLFYVLTVIISLFISLARGGDLEKQSSDGPSDLAEMYKKLGVIPKDSDLALAQVLLERTADAFERLELDSTFAQICQKAGKLMDLESFHRYFARWQELDTHTKILAVQELFSHLEESFYQAAQGTPEQVVFAPHNRMRPAVANRLPPRDTSLLNGILPAGKYFLEADTKRDFEQIQIITHYAQKMFHTYHTYDSVTASPTGTRSGTRTVKMGYFKDYLAADRKQPLGEILYLPAPNSIYWEEHSDGLTFLGKLLTTYFNRIYNERLPRFFTLHRASPEAMPFYNLARLRGYTLEDNRRPFFASYQEALKVYNAASDALNNLYFYKDYKKETDLLHNFKRLRETLPNARFFKSFIDTERFQQIHLFFQQKLKLARDYQEFKNLLKSFNLSPRGGWAMYDDNNLHQHLSFYFAQKLNSGVELVPTDLEELKAAYNLYHHLGLLADESGLRERIFQEILDGKSLAREIQIEKLLAYPSPSHSVSTCQDLVKKLKQKK